MRTRTLIISLIVVNLIVLNVYIFSQPRAPASCYKALCVYGTADAAADLKALRDSSTSVFIVMEGDAGTTQKNAALSAGFGTLAKDFGGKQVTLATIGLENSAPVKCLCEISFSNASTAPCQDNSTTFCTGIKAGPDSALFKISYPAFAETRIVFANRTVDIQAKTGEDAYAAALLVDQLLS